MERETREGGGKGGKGKEERARWLKRGPISINSPRCGMKRIIIIPGGRGHVEGASPDAIDDVEGKVA